MPGEEFLLSLWKKALADAPMCLAFGLAVGVVVWVASVETFASEESLEDAVNAFSKQFKDLEARNANQFTAIQIRIEITKYEQIINEAERFIAQSRRELVELQINDYQGDALVMARARISELNNEIEGAQRDIRQAQSRILELQARQDELAASGVQIID